MDTSVTLQLLAKEKLLSLSLSLSLSHTHTRCRHKKSKSSQNLMELLDGNLQTSPRKEKNGNKSQLHLYLKPRLTPKNSVKEKKEETKQAKL
jgi:hypothetical protein